MKVRMTFVLFLVVFAGVAMAQNNPLKGLDPFIGKFQCKGIAFASPMGPEHATAATVNTQWILGGQWAAFTYAEKKTTVNPKPFTTTGFFGWDAEKKKYVSGGVDNMAGYGTSESDGWTGDTLVFVGPFHTPGGTMNFRDTFTKKNGKVDSHLGEIEMNGTWTKVSQETCK